MKVHICDPCKRLNSQMTETPYNMSVKGKGHTQLKIDVCLPHREEITKLSIADYVRYVFKMDGIEAKGDDREVIATYLR